MSAKTAEVPLLTTEENVQVQFKARVAIFGPPATVLKTKEGRDRVFPMARFYISSILNRIASDLVINPDGRVMFTRGEKGKILAGEWEFTFSGKMDKNIYHLFTSKGITRLGMASLRLEDGSEFQVHVFLLKPAEMLKPTAVTKIPHRVVISMDWPSERAVKVLGQLLKSLLNYDLPAEYKKLDYWKKTRRLVLTVEAGMPIKIFLDTPLFDVNIVPL